VAFKFSIDFNDGIIYNYDEMFWNVKSDTFCIGDTILISIPFSFCYIISENDQPIKRMSNTFSSYFDIITDLMWHAKEHLCYSSNYCVIVQGRSGDLLCNKQVLFCSWFSNDHDFSSGIRKYFQEMHKSNVTPLYVEWLGLYNLKTNKMERHNVDNADSIRLFKFAMTAVSLGTSTVAHTFMSGGTHAVIDYVQSQTISTIATLGAIRADPFGTTCQLITSSLSSPVSALDVIDHTQDFMTFIADHSVARIPAISFTTQIEKKTFQCEVTPKSSNADKNDEKVKQNENIVHYRMVKEKTDFIHLIRTQTYCIDCKKYNCTGKWHTKISSVTNVLYIISDSDDFKNMRLLTESLSRICELKRILIDGVSHPFSKWHRVKTKDVIWY